MDQPQLLSLGLIVVALGLFAWGRLRHDLVALLALLLAVYAGLVPPDQAFLGFGHPAVITVACVLVLSQALTASGAVELLAHRLLPADASVTWQILVLGGLGALVSAVMNNVGALALIMPVAIAAARRGGHSPSLVLMPLALMTMLGGLLTLIGTPSNLVVSDFRRRALGEPFQLFDISLIGLMVTVLGLLYAAFLGWRLLPARKPPQAEELFGIASYITEARVGSASPALGKSFAEIEAMMLEPETRLFGLVRGSHRIPSTAWWERAQAGDVLVFEAAPQVFPRILERLKLESLANPELAQEAIAGEGRTLVEAVVQPRALIAGLTAEEMRLRSRYGVTLVAMSRQGEGSGGRLKDLRFEIGDVLLLQGAPGPLAAAMAALGLLPLAERDLPMKRRHWLPAVGFFALAIGTIAAGLAAPAVALATAVAGLLVTRTMKLSEAYNAVDWPVVVLLGAMLPVGGTLESTGATQVIAGWLLDIGRSVQPWMVLVLVLGVAMLISNVVNNAATAVMMSPIAVALAKGLKVSPDPFLMAVAVGVTMALMTPIGHQNNTLVMGPGGYRFGDYWRFGLLLQVAVLLLGAPMILLVFPF